MNPDYRAVIFFYESCLEIQTSLYSYLFCNLLFIKENFGFFSTSKLFNSIDWFALVLNFPKEWIYLYFVYKISDWNYDSYYETHFVFRFIYKCMILRVPWQSGRLINLKLVQNLHALEQVQFLFKYITFKILSLYFREQHVRSWSTQFSPSSQ